jgi:hypothetical protein
MILDKQLSLSAAQAVTASAASTNVIDQGAPGDAHCALFAMVQVREAATASGSATVNFVIQTSVDEAFTSPIVLFDSGAIGKAALTLNSEPVKVRLPIGVKQFIRGYYTVATGPLTAGKFDMFLVSDVKIG